MLDPLASQHRTTTAEVNVSVDTGFSIMGFGLAHRLDHYLIVNLPRVSRAVDVPVLSIQGSFKAASAIRRPCPQAADEPAAWSPPQNSSCI
jgi:hypothetical protein